MTQAKFIEVIRAELVGSDQCSAAGITVTAPAPVLALCRELLAAGHDRETWLEAFRGGVMCLRVKGIGKGAALAIDETRARFRRWEAYSPARVTAPVRRKAISVVPSSKIALTPLSAALP